MEKKPGDILNSMSTQVCTLALPEGVDTITKDIVKLPEGFEGCIAIPEGVRRIDNECFMGKPITAVSFPKSLREIGMCAFSECRLRELRVEGEGEKVSIEPNAFEGNTGLTAITLGNCELGDYAFMGCPIDRITLTGECIPPEEDDILGFGGCFTYSDNFFWTVSRAYGGVLGTYALKGELAKTSYKQDGDFKGCANECGKYRCYTLAGFEDDPNNKPIFEWEMMV